MIYTLKYYIIMLFVCLHGVLSLPILPEAHFGHKLIFTSAFKTLN